MVCVGDWQNQIIFNTNNHMDSSAINDKFDEW